MISSIAHASTWDKEITQFATSLTLDHHSNIYNREKEEVDSSVSQISVIYHNISLFEGYGLSMPFSVHHYKYSADSKLNNTAYSVSPAVQFFLSPDMTFTLTSNLSKSQLFSGDVGAEFTNASMLPLNKESQRVTARLQIGKAVQDEFFSLNINAIDDELSQSINVDKNDSKSLSSIYGYRISEDSYIQFSGSYARQHSRELATQLAEAGVGFITGVGGSHVMNVIVGGFKRIEEAETGIFWIVSDRWQVSEQLTLKFETTQRSTITHRINQKSQLTTSYQLTGLAKLNEFHELSLSLNQQRSAIKEIDDKANNKGAVLTWLWKISSGFELSTTVSSVENSRSHLLHSRDISQHNIGINVGYQW